MRRVRAGTRGHVHNDNTCVYKRFISLYQVSFQVLLKTLDIFTITIWPNNFQLLLNSALLAEGAVVDSATVVLFCVLSVVESFYTQVTLQFVAAVLFRSNYELMRGSDFVGSTLFVAAEDALAGSANIGGEPAAGGLARRRARCVATRQMCGARPSSRSKDGAAGVDVSSSDAALASISTRRGAENSVD